MDGKNAGLHSSSRLFEKEENLLPCRETDNYFYEGWNFNSGNYLFTTDTK